MPLYDTEEHNIILFEVHSKLSNCQTVQLIMCRYKGLQLIMHFYCYMYVSQITKTCNFKFEILMIFPELHCHFHSCPPSSLLAILANSGCQTPTNLSHPHNCDGWEMHITCSFSPRTTSEPSGSSMSLVMGVNIHGHC